MLASHLAVAIAAAALGWTAKWSPVVQVTCRCTQLPGIEPAGETASLSEYSGPFTFPLYGAWLIGALLGVLLVLAIQSCWRSVVDSIGLALRRDDAVVPRPLALAPPLFDYHRRRGD
jgi:hypothetical protein